MDPERWQRVERICADALELEEGRRADFLKEACSGDAALRRDVDRLLAQETKAAGFLETPALDVEAEALAQTLTPSPGTGPTLLGETISHYKILEEIGRGGMGVVYRGKDTRLGRPVAVKFLPLDHFEDPHAVKRFRREARAASALNHPYICTLYDIGEHRGQPFIVMEFLEGRTLDQRLEAEALSTAEALKLAGQIADALEAAHQQGIVHRDLKPANIFLTERGDAKVLDFGLAKRFFQDGEVEEESLLTLTREGTTLGTLPYMSPEQIRGLEVDPRSDIFSFGVLLYEMLTRIHPFRKGLPVDTATAIQSENPPLMARYNEEVSDLLQHMVRKMLAKNPQDRYQSVHEVRTNLDQMIGHPGAPVSQTRSVALTERLAPLKEAAKFSVPFPRWVVLASLALLLGSAALVWAWLPDTQEPEPVVDAVEPDSRSIAVLPLENLSADPDNEYFSDGITETIISQLSKISALQVVSRTSVMRFKGSEKSLGEIAEELGVATILEGSVQRTPTTIRIQARLVDAGADRSLWTETYDRELKEVFAIQSDVAEQIAEALHAELSPDEVQSVEQRPTESFEAYNLYLQGRHFRSIETEASLRRAADYFQRALDLDPGYTLAQAGLTYAYLGFGGWDGADAWSDAAEEAARRALQLDDGSPDAHVALGIVLWHVPNDWEGAEASFRRALAISPNHFDAHRELGLMLMRELGRVKEATVHLRRARELDPLAAPTAGDLSDALAAGGRFDESMPLARKMVELEPGWGWSYNGVARKYLALAEYETADEWFSRARQQNALLLGSQPYAVMSLLWRGETDRAVEMAEPFLNARRTPAGLALAGYLRLARGEKEQARTFLEEAIGLNPAAFPGRGLPPSGVRATTQLGYLLWDTDRTRAEVLLSQSLQFDGYQEIVSRDETRRPSFLYDIALVMAIRGEKEEAYRWLQRAIDAGWLWYDTTPQDPMWEDFRGQLRFQQMMVQMKSRVDVMRQRVREMEKEWD